MSKISNMTTLLWLDDYRQPSEAVDFDKFDSVIWVKSYSEFNEWISQNGLPTKISFDYDLGKGIGIDSYDGLSCVKAVLRFCTEDLKNIIKFPRFSIHSEHPYVLDLRTYITSSIKRYGLGEIIEENMKKKTEDQLNYEKSKTNGRTKSTYRTW